MTPRGFGMGFFGRGPFDKEARINFKENWMKMSDSEKLEFMNKKMEALDSHEDHFSVKSIDARCEEWMKMTQEEKEAFINERKKTMEERIAFMGGFFNRMHQ